MTAGPALEIASPTPRKNPAPITPPTAIIVRCRDFSERWRFASSCPGVMAAPSHRRDRGGARRVGGYLTGERVSDVASTHKDDVIELLAVFKQPRKRVRTGGMPRDPRMHPDRHHAPVIVTVVPQPIDRRFAVREEIVRAGKAGAQDVSTVVGHEGIWDEEVSPALHQGPVAQVVGVTVGVVQEPTFLHEEAAGVHAHLPAVPPDGPSPSGPLQQHDRVAYDRAYFVLVHLEYIAPTVHVPDDLVAADATLL